MKKIFLIAFVLLCGTVSLCAQNTAFRALKFERGKSSELKGLTKLYVNTGTDAVRRNQIVEEIEKAGIPRLTVVTNREDAEIVMRFGGDEEEVMEGLNTNPVLGTDWTMTTVDRRVVLYGRGMVFIAGKDRTLPRIVMTYKNTQDKAFGKRPATEFAERFIAAYKEANGLK